MKKILVLLLMFTLFSAVSCDDEEGRQGGIVEPGNSFLIYHPNPDPNGDVNDEREVTELEEYNKDGVRIYSKFMDALSTGNSGWAVYRWSSDHAATDGVTANDATDCDGEYKVSYLERAVDNYFVGAGVCLDMDTGRTYDDARVQNLDNLIHLAMTSANGIQRTEIINATTDELVDTRIGEVCTAYDAANIPSLTWRGNNLNNENEELFVFIAEVVLDSTTVVDSTTVGSGGTAAPTTVPTVSSVDVVCHPDSSQEGENIYGATDDSGRAYIKEVVDELLGFDFSGHGAVAEGVWSVHTGPKLNEAGNELEPDTLNDSPKLSYFRISGEAGPNGRRFMVGGGIYLDANNENEVTGNELTEIRQRVRTAVGQLRGAEADLEEGEELSSLFADESDFITDDATDPNDFYSTAIISTDQEAYIFVWENR